MKWTVVLLALALVYGVAGAADYYVEKSGDDNNDGTIGASWLTLGKAASVMVAGDTVWVGAGTYAETVTTGASGTGSSRITYQAQSTNTRVLSFTVNKAFNTIRGFSIYGDAGIVGGLSGSVYVTGGGHHLNLISNVFPSSAVSVAQLHVHYASSDPATNLFAAHNRFINGWTHAVRIEGGGFHVISNNYLHSPNGYDAFRIAATNITIVGNTITNWSNLEVTSAPLKVGVRYYFVTTNGTMDFSNVGAGSPPYTEGEGFSWLCTATTPNSFGSAVLQVSNHPDIIQAFAVNNTGAVPPNIPSRDLVFERNRVIDCTGGTQFGNLEDLGDHGIIDRWTFRNNVFVRIERTMNLYAPGFSFHNNTFYRCGVGSGWTVIFNNAAKGVARDLTVYNNLFVECGTATNPNNGWMAGATAPNQLMDYNLVVGTGAGTTKGSSWTSGGRNGNGINGSDPLFVNAAALDFRLQSGSPAIGAGINLNSSFTTDYAGTTRGSTWDMGAFEFAAGGSETPEITVFPSTRDYGSIALGVTRDQTFSLQNSGTGTLSGSASVGAPFSIVSGSPYSLGSGQSQTVVVRYSPASLGTNLQPVSFTGGSGATSSVRGVGVGNAIGSYYVLCEGDSITYGTGASPRASSNYVAQLALQIPGTTFENIGASGHQIEDHYSGSDAIDNLAAAFAYTTKTVVFQMGNNDIAVNTSVGAITNYIGLWMAAVRAAHPDVRICGMTLIAGSYGEAKNPERQPRRTALNEAIRASLPFDYLVDLAADPRLSDYTDTRYYDADQVHLNNAGYAVIASLVKEVLLSNGRAGLGLVKPVAPLNLRRP